jgi:hypothetical protein
MAWRAEELLVHQAQGVRRRDLGLWPQLRSASRVRATKLLSGKPEPRR